MQTSQFNWRRNTAHSRFHAPKMNQLTPDMISIPDPRKQREPTPEPKSEKLVEMLDTFDNTKVRKALHKITPKAAHVKFQGGSNSESFGSTKQRALRSTVGIVTRSRGTAS